MYKKFSEDEVISSLHKILVCKTCGESIDYGGCSPKCEWDGSHKSLRSPNSMYYVVFERVDTFLKEEPYVRPNPQGS